MSRAKPVRRSEMGGNVSLIACGGAILLIAAVVAGIGWSDGYWSKQQTAQHPSKQQHSRQEAQR
jgi:hypothetical protein